MHSCCVFIATALAHNVTRRLRLFDARPDEKELGGGACFAYTRGLDNILVIPSSSPSWIACEWTYRK